MNTKTAKLSYFLNRYRHFLIIGGAFSFFLLIILILPAQVSAPSMLLSSKPTKSSPVVATIPDTKSNATTTTKANTAPATTPTAQPNQPDNQTSTTSHNAFPAAVKLSNGSILLVYRGAANHYPTKSIGSLYKKYSNDNGKTWSQPVKINLNTQNNVSDPGLLVVKSGALKNRIILTYFESLTSRSAAKIALSNDYVGTNWGTITDISFDPSWATDLISAPAVQLSDNTFMVAGYGRQNANQPFSVKSARLQYDNSGSFKVIATALIASGGGDASPTRSFSEPNVIKLQNGTLMALIRTNNWGSTPLSIRKSYSVDGGNTWSAQLFAFSGEGNPHLIQVANGTIYTSYRHWAGSQSSFVAGQHWPVYRTSTSNGDSWSGETKYGDAQKWMSYAALVEYQPNRVVSIWSQEDSETDAKLVVSYFN